MTKQEALENFTELKIAGLVNKLSLNELFQLQDLTSLETPGSKLNSALSAIIDLRME